MATGSRPRRSKGEGTIGKRTVRGKVQWYSRLEVGPPGADGKRQQRWFYGSTRAEVVGKLKAEQEKLTQGERTEVGTVREQLDRWLASRKRTDQTYRVYSQIIRTHLEPTLGSMPLDRLVPSDVEAMIDRKAQEEWVMANGRSGKGYAPAHLKMMRQVLEAALRMAKKDGLIDRNVAAEADSVKVPAKPIQHFSIIQANQLRAFLAKGAHPLEGYVNVAVALGLRPSEAFGLMWAEDVDLDSGWLHVSHQILRLPGGGWERTPRLKTDFSRRSVPLPPQVVSALVKHRAQQEQFKLFASKRWTDHGLVFCSSVGTPHDLHNFNGTWRKLLSDVGLPYIPLKNTRATAATILRAQGVPIEVISEILGHSNIRTTNRYYAAIDLEAAETARRARAVEAMKAMERALG